MKLLLFSSVGGLISSGNHQFIWDAVNHPSGIYVIKMDINGFGETQKIILMK
jgi:hypothetical protein